MVAKKKAAKKKPVNAPDPATQRPFAGLAKRVKAPPVPEPPPASARKTTAAATVGPTLADPRSYDHLRDVKPLPGKARRLPATVSSLDAPVAIPAAADRPDLDAPARAALHRLVSDGLRFEVIDDGDALEGRRLDVDPREIRKLRRQSYPADGSLDLHGHSAEEARRAVEAFVRRRRQEGDRAVRIIHGKGLHSKGGFAVLRGEMGAWLSQGPAARDVLAFASVADPDGASGALFVLLAKR